MMMHVDERRRCERVVLLATSLWMAMLVPAAVAVEAGFYFVGASIAFMAWLFYSAARVGQKRLNADKTA